MESVIVPTRREEIVNTPDNSDTELKSHTMGENNEIVNPIPFDILPKLDPSFVEYYNKHLASRLGTHQVPLQEVRSNPHLWEPSPILNQGSTGDATICEYVIETGEKRPGSVLKVRAYRPSASTFGPGPYAAHINFHGKVNSLLVI